MNRPKLRVKNTQLDNLISHLRGEVGEVVMSWVLLRHLRMALIDYDNLLYLSAYDS